MSKFAGFQKGLKSRHVSFIALGGIIGSSYFLGTGYILNQVGPAACLAYMLGGLITFLTMACLAELSTADPMHGSFVSYSVKYISPSWACGVGWSYWVSWIVFIPSECIAAGILMHVYAPELSVDHWSMLFGIIITIVNLLHVKVFGEMEFWLALIKILLLAGFSFLAICIFFGLIPNHPHEVIGTKYLLGDGGLFPSGFTIVLVSMVVLLANFQGSEIIGLSAAESHDPLKNIPSALNKTSYRIVGLYLVPTFLLALIFPWQEAGLSQSVFAEALSKYGLVSIAKVFSFLVIASALSCANSGLYAAVRSLHGLASHRMGPHFLTKLSRHGIPIYATLLTMGTVWVMLIAAYFFASHSFYANLLAISGFTGSMCWISICWAQLRFRKQLIKEGHPAPTVYRIKGFPYITLFAIWVQVICLCVVIMSPELRMSFYLGAPSMLLPIIVYKFTKHRKPIL